jgi:hypothetical protein
MWWSVRAVKNRMCPALDADLQPRPRSMTARPRGFGCSQKEPSAGFKPKIEATQQIARITEMFNHLNQGDTVELKFRRKFIEISVYGYVEVAQLPITERLDGHHLDRHFAKGRTHAAAASTKVENMLT